MAHRTRGAKLFGSFTPVCVVPHGLRRSRFVDRRLCGQTTCSRGICHLLGEYTVARPVRMQRRPVSRTGQQRFVLDDGLVEQNLHSTFEIVLRLENGLGRIVRFSSAITQNRFFRTFGEVHPLLCCYRMASGSITPCAGARLRPSSSVISYSLFVRCGEFFPILQGYVRDRAAREM
jgi:hypothetical protein